MTRRFVHARRSPRFSRLAQAENEVESRSQYLYRADTFTPSGANLASLQNRGTAGSADMSVIAGTVVAPVADSAIGGRFSFTMSGTQRLQSALASSAYKFLHDGTGCYGYAVFVRTDASNTRMLMATANSAGGIGVHVYQSAAGFGFSVANGGGFTYGLSGAAGVLNTLCVLEFSYAEASTPKTALYDRGTLLGSGSAGGAPSALDPTGTLRIGATANDGLGYIGRIAEVMCTAGVPTATDRARYLSYISLMYGL
jgi:hypothetical protein